VENLAGELLVVRVEGRAASASRDETGRKRGKTGLALTCIVEGGGGGGAGHCEDVAIN
jgi:hypothetical protein